jgi:hypothetical protein
MTRARPHRELIQPGSIHSAPALTHGRALACCHDSARPRPPMATKEVLLGSVLLLWACGTAQSSPPNQGGLAPPPSAGGTATPASPGKANGSPQPDAGDLCARAAAELQGPPPPPPQQERSATNSCQADGDCAVKPLGFCRCPPVGYQWHEAVNRQEAKRIENLWASRRCEQPACPGCPGRMLGEAVKCVADQCVVR